MRLSVIIPVYNVARWLPACLDTVLAAAEGRSVEVICVDDGSTDRSAEILARRPVTMLTQANGGYGAAVNRGLDAASGDFVTFVEPDDRVAAAAWDQPLALLDAHADADFARAPYLEERRWRRTVAVGLKSPPSGAFAAYERPDLLFLPPAIWSGVYRRRALEAIGLRLPETPGAGFQDTYFSMLLLLSGARAIWANRPYYRYRADRPGASRDGRRRADEIMRIHDFVLRDLPEAARARADFPALFHAAYFRRLLWFFERVSPGFQEEAFREAYTRFCPVWRDAALSSVVAALLSPYQRAVFAEFAAGRIDAFHREFGRPAPRRRPPAPRGEFALADVVRRDIASLLPAWASGPASETLLRPVAWTIAAGLAARIRLGRRA